jgi:site-specific recombinase XerD
MTRPLGLKIGDWPAIDRQLWLDARTPLRFDRRSRIAGRWSERRCRIVCQAYAQWLAFLARTGSLDPAALPEARVTPERIEAFVSELQARVSPWSVAIMVQAVQRMLVVLAPDNDWQWLAAVVANLKHIAGPARDKRPHMVDPHQLYALGIDLMVQARRLAADGRYHAATTGRDGLMIAMLIACPIRIANLTMIELGRHLVADGNVYHLRFSPEETKTSREIEAELPADLTPWVDDYLREHRQQLLARGNGDPTRHLWISRWGTPMVEHAVRQQIEKRTCDAFGRHVWPHLFRAIAATGMIDHAPEQAGVLPDLLGHGDFQTSKRYYVLSSGALAHEAVQSTMFELRKAAAARLKVGTKP